MSELVPVVKMQRVWHRNKRADERYGPKVIRGHKFRRYDGMADPLSERLTEAIMTGAPDVDALRYQYERAWRLADKERAKEERSVQKAANIEALLGRQRGLVEAIGGLPQNVADMLQQAPARAQAAAGVAPPIGSGYLGVAEPWGGPAPWPQSDIPENLPEEPLQPESIRRERRDGLVIPDVDGRGSGPGGAPLPPRKAAMALPPQPQAPSIAPAQPALPNVSGSAPMLKERGNSFGSDAVVAKYIEAINPSLLNKKGVPSPAGKEKLRIAAAALQREGGGNLLTTAGSLKASYQRGETERLVAKTLEL